MEIIRTTGQGVERIKGAVYKFLTSTNGIYYYNIPADWIKQILSLVSAFLCNSDCFSQNQGVVASRILLKSNLKILLRRKKKRGGIYLLNLSLVHNPIAIETANTAILPALYQLNWWRPEKIIWEKTYFFHYICQSHRQLLPQKHKGGLFTSIHRSWKQTRWEEPLSGSHKAAEAKRQGETQRELLGQKPQRGSIAIMTG